MAITTVVPLNVNYCLTNTLQMYENYFFKSPPYKWKWELLNIMRSLIFLLCTTVFSLNTITTFSQEKIVVNRNKLVTVDEVFDIIKEQTNFKFIYLSDAFIKSPKVQLYKGRC